VRISERCHPAERLVGAGPASVAVHSFAQFGERQFFSTSANGETTRDDKGSFRVDGNSAKWGTLSAYYFFDDYTVNNPYPTGQGGASVPGFNALNLGRAQLGQFG
jgi:hypothetical protein